MSETNDRALVFGFFPEPLADRFDDIVEQVRRAERIGFDLVGMQDHPYQRRFLDTWSLLAVLATHTSRMGLFADVANLPLRHPAMLAKAAASIDVMSEGRFEVGLGAGGFWDAIAAMDGPRRAGGDAVDALEEAITVMRMMWSGKRGLRFDGSHYRLAGVHAGPAPAHDLSIWVGGYRPRMLELIGRVGDGWLPSLGPLRQEQLAESHERIDDACVAAGREPSEIFRLLNVFGRISNEQGDGPLDGPVTAWVDKLSELATKGRIEAFIVGFGDRVEAQLEIFAEEVIPAVRRNIGEAADAGPTPVDRDRLLVHHYADRFMFEIELDGSVAGYSEYRSGPGIRTFIHTVVDEHLRGRGIGEVLVAEALDETRREGFLVEPFCRFVRSFIAERPEYVSLVPADQQADFGLAG